SIPVQGGRVVRCGRCARAHPCPATLSPRRFRVPLPGMRAPARLEQRARRPWPPPTPPEPAAVGRAVAGGYLRARDGTPGRVLLRRPHEMCSRWVETAWHGGLPDLAVEGGCALLSSVPRLPEWAYRLGDGFPSIRSRTG